MSSAPSRLMLRHNRVVARRSALRHASTTAEATQAASNTAAKGKETASAAASKASEGLSKVSSSAGPALNRAAQGVSNSVNQLGGRMGRLLNFAQCKSPFSNHTKLAILGQLMRDARSTGSVLAPIVLTSQTLQASYCLFLSMRSQHTLGFHANFYGIALYPPALYYSKVGLELSKLVFQGQKMSPP